MTRSIPLTYRALLAHEERTGQRRRGQIDGLSRAACYEATATGYERDARAIEQRAETATDPWRWEALAAVAWADAADAYAKADAAMAADLDALEALEAMEAA